MTVDPAGHRSTTTDAAPTRPSRRSRRAELRTVAINLVLPTALFYVLRRLTHNDVAALACAGSVPLLRALTGLVRGHRVEPLAVFSGVSFLGSLVVYWLTGGSPLPLELHEAVLTGGLGLGIAVAAAFRKPVGQVLVRLAPPALGAHLHDQMDGPSPARMSGRTVVVLVVVGTTLLVHAVALVVLALTVPVTRYFPLASMVGLPILVVGFGIAACYRALSAPPRPTATARRRPAPADDRPAA